MSRPKSMQFNIKTQYIPTVPDSLHFGRGSTKSILTQNNPYDLQNSNSKSMSTFGQGYLNQLSLQNRDTKKLPKVIKDYRSNRDKISDLKS